MIPNRHCQYRGFTLLELLVVAAVIAVLLGILLPVLAKAKRRAKAAVCLNNVKQLQLCWHLFTVDTDDEVPLNRSEYVAGVWRSSTNSWIGGSNAALDRDTLPIEQGILFKYDYNRNMRVYKCPDDSSVVAPDNVPRTRSYSMSGAFGGRKEESQTVILKAGACQNSSSAFVFIEEHQDSIDDAHFLTWSAPDSRWVNLPADRHDRGCCLSFADGHVEYWQWRWPKSWAGRVAHYKPAQNADDLRDLRRLQRALPNSR